MEQELSLRDVLGVLRRRAWIVLVVVFVAVVMAALLSYVILPPAYQSNTTLIVNEKQSATQNDNSINYGQIQTYQALAVTYAKIITSRTILQDTISRLSLSETVGQLTGMTTVAVQGNTEIISVSVKDKDAARAALIANTIATSFIQQLPKLVNQVDNVTVIDRAVPVTQQVSPRPLLNIAVALVAALMLGVLLAFLVDYFDDTVKTPDDIKKLFGLRVLAVVPDVNAKGARHGRAY
jgi:capsular polysaccharide biosynthesis protein